MSLPTRHHRSISVCSDDKPEIRVDLASSLITMKRVPTVCVQQHYCMYLDAVLHSWCMATGVFGCFGLFKNRLTFETHTNLHQTYLPDQLIKHRETYEALPCIHSDLRAAAPITRDVVERDEKKRSWTRYCKTSKMSVSVCDQRITWRTRGGKRRV